MNEVAHVTHSINDLQVIAKAFVGSKLFGVKSMDEAIALMCIAQAEGRHPATIAQDYDIIQGRPALKSLAALARFQLAGGSVRWIVSDSTQAEAEFSHPRGGSLVIRWDMERAKSAQLTGKDNWRKFPDQMLRARCAAEGVRAVFPACLNGMYVSEEVTDFDAPAEAPKATRKAPLAISAGSIQTVAEEIVPREEIECLIEELRGSGIPRESVDTVMAGTKLKDMTRAQYIALGALVQERGDEVHQAETESPEGDEK